MLVRCWPPAATRRVAFALLTFCTAPLFSQISDVTPPRLVSFSFTPATVDVTAAGRNIVFSLGITDDLSGTTFNCVPCSYSAIGFRRPSGLLQTRAPNPFTLASGTALNGVWQLNQGISRYSEAGVWTVDFITLKDVVGNTVTYRTADLQALGFPTDFTVIDATPDTTPPQLTSFSLTPSTVDVSAGPQTVTVALGLVDSPAGVTYFAGAFLGSINLTLRSPSNAQRQQESNFNFSLDSGTFQNGIWKVKVTIPQYAEAGIWQVVSVFASDNAINGVTFNTAALQSLGFSTTLTVNSTRSDTAPPQLASFSFTPLAINTSAGTQPVTVNLATTDDLSGINFFGALATPNFNLTKIQFASPSGAQVQTLDPFGDPAGGQPQAFSPTLFSLVNPFVKVGGTPLNGTWQGTLIFPQFSEAGTWKVKSVVLQDAAGNTTTLSTSQLATRGFPTELVVMKPSLAIDGTLGPGGGTVSDEVFGTKAQITVPAGLLSTNTSISIDVFQAPLSVPTPQGFSAPGTRFVNLGFNPEPTNFPLPAPGITLVLPLVNAMAPNSILTLYRIDPVTGNLNPATSVVPGQPVRGVVQADGVSARFTGIASLSTVVGLIPTGAIPGDLNGDGRIDCIDLGIVKASFGKRTGQTGFDPRADVNNDGVVNIYDLAFVTRQLPAGTTCP